MSERRSPPTDRVIRVLTALTDASEEPMTLTDIATALDLNKPTCLGILNELVRAGFVTRSEEKTYGLGPELARVGAAAASVTAALSAMRPHLECLASDLALEVIVSAVVDDEIVILDGVVTPGRGRGLLGLRFPFRPPLGVTNVAFSTDDAVEDWLLRRRIGQVPEHSSVLEEVIAAARRDGYLVERIPEGTTTNVLLADLVASDLPPATIDAIATHLPPPDFSEYYTEAPREGETISVSHLSAPILDADGHQRYALTLLVQRPEVAAAECTIWARRLVRSANGIAALLSPGSRAEPASARGGAASTSSSTRSDESARG